MDPNTAPKKSARRRKSSALSKKTKRARVMASKQSQGSIDHSEMHDSHCIDPPEMDDSPAKITETRSHLHAIDFAKSHGISLVPGRKIYGDGNCAFNAAICNINDRCCYADRFLEPVLAYRRRWVTALQLETELHHPDLIGGLAGHLTEEQRMMEWEALKNNGIWNSDLGDLLAHAVSTGTRKVIFIINYNLPYPYPVSIIVPERFGVNRDSNIPVILVYDGSHYENLIPVSDTDQEKVIDLVGVYSEEISRPALQPPGALQPQCHLPHDILSLHVPRQPAVLHQPCQPMFLHQPSYHHQPSLSDQPHVPHQPCISPNQLFYQNQPKCPHPSSDISKKWSVKKNACFKYDASIDYEKAASIGAMNNICEHCGARKYKKETPSLCCAGGKIKLPRHDDPPEPLKSLVSGKDSESTEFLRNILRYNACFQMTSFGTSGVANQDGWMSTFKAYGQVYHRIGSILPVRDKTPQFLQIYFMENEEHQAQHRCTYIDGVDEHTVRDIQRMLVSHNAYINSFRYALEMAPHPGVKIVIRADKTPAGQHPGRYNRPTANNEVAVLLAGDTSQPRDIILEQRDEKLIRICETHRSYDALQYPLMFVGGEDGYHFMYQMTNGKKVSCKDFYSYRCMIRANEMPLGRFGKLFSKFAVDMFVKIISERLLYIRLHQKELLVDSYHNLQEAVNRGESARNVGRRFILPSSFTGGPRYMHEYTQDGMTYVRNYGRPDLFITFTCNPAWPEITCELLPGQHSSERHDISSRVFRQKEKILTKLLTKEGIFGDFRCFMQSNEWQKRGLPHLHTLLWLKERLRPTQIDDIISAEIPNPEEDKILHDLVAKHMIHGPCDRGTASPCLKDGKCTKGFPKSFQKETITDRDGYPLYRRRDTADGGFTTKVKDNTVDNRWVVPYNPLLLRVFHSHINVEACFSVGTIKYVLKYVNKGSDQAVFGLQPDEDDEIKAYECGRYVSTNEALWRIFDFPVHERYPSVQHLAVHLKDRATVCFREDNAEQRAQIPPRTTLTAFFELNEKDTFCRGLLYCEVPRYYTWNTSSKKFIPRKQGAPVPGHDHVKSSDVLGRVYTVHPSNSESYHLRLLLHHVRGATSYQDIRTVNGRVFETFHDACMELGLLEDDRQWHLTLQEAAVVNSAQKQRRLFAIILTECFPSSPNQLWTDHRDGMSEDILHAHRVASGNSQLECNYSIFNAALVLLEDVVLAMKGKPLSDYGMTAPKRTDVNHGGPEIMQETYFDYNNLEQRVQTNEPLLVPDQMSAYKTIIDAVSSKAGGIFYLDAPGGTGKTFLMNLILAKVRTMKHIVLAVASSGIAATLLDGGKTAHSSLKIPLDITSEDLLCDINRGSAKAELLRHARLIVWDECTMSHRVSLEAVDRTLKDLRGNDSVMGGITVLFAGDFRQTLPVIPKGTPADQIKACVKESYLWHKVRKLTLTTNMRVALQNDSEAGDFSSTLLKIGNGEIPAAAENGMIEIPARCATIVPSLDELIENVYPAIDSNLSDHEWLCERTIMAPKNDDVNSINNLILNRMCCGSLRSYKSIDTMPDDADMVHFPAEFLNSLQPSGLPQHILKLKEGVPIMLLRNLDPPKLCNGTRLVVKQMFNNVIEAIVLTGCAKGDRVTIPRIPISPSNSLIVFRRLQFPIRVAFAMTINKAQGQSFKKAGVDLSTPCFAHGQLYVALSRVGSGRNMYIKAENGKTHNIVYPRVLRN